MTAIEVLAQFISDFPADAVTSSLENAARRCLLDLIGSACSGFETESAGAARAAARRLFPEGPASVWFSEEELSAPAAAFCNAAAGSALDLDDGYRDAAGHPGAGVIPICLAAAQETGATFRETAVAIILGYEVGCRIAAARNLPRLPTMATGRWIAYGAAAALAYLYHYPAQTTAHALAIAGIHSPDMAAAGYSRMMGNHVKEGIPWAVLAGAAAVQLAVAGMTGPLDILNHPDTYDAPRILEGLGDRWVIEKVYFKPYGCCRWIHAAIDALLTILRDHSIPADTVDEIRVATFRRAVEGLTNETKPTTVEAAQYSLPFSLAVAAYEGKQGLLPLQPSTLKRRDLTEWAEKVRMEVDPELDRLFPTQSPARVSVTVGNRRLEHTVYDPRGNPANPLSLEELVEKFEILTGNILETTSRRSILKLLTHEKTDPLPGLFELLVKPL